MEVLTIEHSAFQQLISKIEAMDEFIRKAKLEQQSSLDDDSSNSSHDNTRDYDSSYDYDDYEEDF